jgi:hypothetical protein
VNPDTFLIVAFGIMIALFVLMIAVGLPRGKRMQQTNLAIESNQRRLIENSERQTAALERIASAPEKRG